jgi:hypothetical protein
MTHHLSITMKNVIVGLDEALWDVLPNGKKIRWRTGKLCVSRCPVRSQQYGCKCHRQRQAR